MMAKIFDKISETISLINRFHAFNAVEAFLDLLVTVINVTYLIFDVIAHSRNLSNFLIIGGACMYIATTGIICILIFAYSSLIYNIQEKIIAKNNSIGMKFSNLKLRKFSIISTMHLENSKNEISCSLFLFNWKHIFLMMSSYFSYLIVMMQFDFMINTN